MRILANLIASTDTHELNRDKTVYLDGFNLHTTTSGHMNQPFLSNFSTFMTDSLRTFIFNMGDTFNEPLVVDTARKFTRYLWAYSLAWSDGGTGLMSLNSSLPQYVRKSRVHRSGGPRVYASDITSELMTRNNYQPHVTISVALPFLNSKTYPSDEVHDILRDFTFPYNKLHIKESLKDYVMFNEGVFVDNMESLVAKPRYRSKSDVRQNIRLNGIMMHVVVWKQIWRQGQTSVDNDIILIEVVLGFFRFGADRHLRKKSDFLPNIMHSRATPLVYARKDTSSIYVRSLI